MGAIVLTWPGVQIMGEMELALTVFWRGHRQHGESKIPFSSSPPRPGHRPPPPPRDPPKWPAATPLRADSQQRYTKSSLPARANATAGRGREPLRRFQGHSSSSQTHHLPQLRPLFLCFEDKAVGLSALDYKSFFEIMFASCCCLTLIAWLC